MDKNLALGRLYPIGLGLEDSNQYIYKNEDPPKLEYIPNQFKNKEADSLTYEQKGHLELEFIGNNEIKVIYKFPNIDGYPVRNPKEFKIHYNELEVNNKKSISIRDDFIESMEYWEKQQDCLTLHDRSLIRYRIERQFNVFQRVLENGELERNEFWLNYEETKDKMIHDLQNFHANGVYTFVDGFDLVFDVGTESLRKEIKEIVTQEFARLRDTLEFPHD